MWYIPAVGELWDPASDLVGEIPLIGGGLEKGMDTVGDIVGGVSDFIFGEDPSGAISNMLKEGARQGTSAITSGYGDASGFLQPYSDVGVSALDTQTGRLQSGYYDVDPYQVQQFSQFQSQDPMALQKTLDPTTFDPTTDAGYQYRLEQAEEALGRKAATGGTAGGRFGSESFKELGQTVGQMASDEFDKAYGRAQQQDVTDYGRALQRDQETYQRMKDLYGYDIGREQLQADQAERAYGYDVAGKERDYGRWQDLLGLGYGAGKGQAELAYTRGSDLAQMYTDLASAEAAAKAATTDTEGVFGDILGAAGGILQGAGAAGLI